MTKVLISGYYGFNNFGDETILSVLCEHLKSIGTDITVLSSSPNSTADKLGVNSINSFNVKDIINAIKKTDYLISGGGSLLQDVTSLKSLIYYSFIIFLAQIFRKKVIIFAQGIGPLNSIISKFVVLNLLKKCEYITVRDEESQKFLELNKINSQLVVDPVFSLELAPHNCEGSIGIQLRDFKNVTDDFLMHLAGMIEKYFYGKNIKLISVHDSLDYPVLNKFSKILAAKNIQFSIVDNLESKEVIDLISKLDTLIAMRFHCILIGLKTKVKTLAINYDKKVEILANDFNLPMIDLQNFEKYNEQFGKLSKIDCEECFSICKTKNFDWNKIDSFLT